jgi:hypothetical protein
MYIDDVLFWSKSGYLVWEILTANINIEDIAKYPNLPWKWPSLCCNPTVKVILYWDLKVKSLIHYSAEVKLLGLPQCLQKFCPKASYIGKTTEEVISIGNKLCIGTIKYLGYTGYHSGGVEHYKVFNDNPELWCWNCIFSYCSYRGGKK